MNALAGSDSLWDWAGAAYGLPGVEAACLRLQDEHGQCVALLLWSLWAAHTGRAPSRQAMRYAADLARPWHDQVIAPLRSARRALKDAEMGVDPAGQAALRARIKAEELAAEQLLLQALETLTDAPDGPPAAPFDVLLAVSAAWSGAPAPPEALRSLARSFSSH